MTDEPRRREPNPRGLPPALQALNDLCRDGHGRQHHRFIQFRNIVDETRDSILMHKLGDAAQYVVLSAIAARTLHFGKLVEVITLDEFVHGVRDRQTGHLATLTRKREHHGTFGRPVFAGCGLSRPTVTKALGGLIDKGVISRFKVPRRNLPETRWPRAYMPLHIIDVVFLQDLLARPEMTEGDFWRLMNGAAECLDSPTDGNDIDLWFGWVPHWQNREPSGRWADPAGWHARLDDDDGEVDEDLVVNEEDELSEEDLDALPPSPPLSEEQQEQLARWAEDLDRRTYLDRWSRGAVDGGHR